MIDIKIRISRRFILWVAAIMLALFLLSWALISSGGSTRVAVGSVQRSPSPPGSGSVWSIHKGMTEGDVLRLLGMPFHRTTFGKDNPQVCWSYRASKPNTAVDARVFCFVDNRIVRILTGVHG
jgi:hypothetical protein